MSVSDADRRQDRERTLLRTLAAVGDRYVIEVAVEPTDAGFENALPTTWRELLDDGLINDKFSTLGGSALRLTAVGWLRAMLVSGTVDTPECSDRRSRLAAALKAVVKGRASQYDGLTTEHEIAAADLPRYASDKLEGPSSERSRARCR